MFPPHGTVRFCNFEKERTPVRKMPTAPRRIRTRLIQTEATFTLYVPAATARDALLVKFRFAQR